MPPIAAQVPLPVMKPLDHAHPLAQEDSAHDHQQQAHRGGYEAHSNQRTGSP